MTDRFIRGLSIDWNLIPQDSYLRGILALTRLDRLDFSHNVTLFAGENGTGKSTLVEAIAVTAEFNREGGTFNYAFETFDDVSELNEAMTLIRGFSRPKCGQYLRAESFFNVATAALEEYNYDGQMYDLHVQSHGESFLYFLSMPRTRGLFIMDEPEAALSPRRQIELSKMIQDRAHDGSQFIIATHSPILLGIPDAQILSFDDGYVREVMWRETSAVQAMREFLDSMERTSNR